ncbi:hypothetical protein V8C86DRAFT_3089889 [Haematococcus lacustris]
MAMPVFINVVNTAVLAASNRPWFDNVALNTEPESFAQLRLLFTAGDMKWAMGKWDRSEADSRSLATIHKERYKEGVFVS